MLAHGNFRIGPLPEDFPGETQEGAEIMVAKVAAALRARFPGGCPAQVLFTDRGNGFYNAGSGQITTKYRAALRKHGLRAFFPASASIQPGQPQEVMLHETAASWTRAQLAKTLPKNSWEETVDAYCARRRTCASHINNTCDMGGLCREAE